MRVTIRQIAEESGVSRGTVDRVLNNRGKVRPEVEERVRKVAEELGYKPNLLGRALIKMKENIKIGVILQDTGTPYLKTLSDGIKKAKGEVEDFGGTVIVKAVDYGNVEQTLAAMNKLVRAGRAMQAGVYFVTQSAYDVSKESLKNNIGLKFAFRSTDINEIKQTLEFFGIDKDDENNQKRLRDLENGQCLLQDLYGRVGVVQIHPVFEELLHAFDTRPPVQRNEVE